MIRDLFHWDFPALIISARMAIDEIAVKDLFVEDKLHFVLFIKDQTK